MRCRHVVATYAFTIYAAESIGRLLHEIGTIPLEKYKKEEKDSDTLRCMT